MALGIRDDVDADATGWLRCRLLSFFDTVHHDDAVVERPQFAGPVVRPVADRDRMVVGLIGVSIDGSAATIEAIGVLPEHRRAGAAGQLLLAAIERPPATVRTFDARTREMPAANAWYQANGFVERLPYVNVSKAWDEPAVGWAAPAGVSAPVRAFAHAPIDHEADRRARFRRVSVCRQYVRDV